MTMSTASDERYCTFYLGTECYGVDILTVREINRNVVVTPVPGAAEAVRGLMNLRGQIVTVIDPSLRLGGGAHSFGKATRLVILKTNAELAERVLEGRSTSDDLVGLCVDRISDVISVPEGGLDPPPPDQVGCRDGLIAGIAQRADEVIRVLDPCAVSNREERE